MQSSHSDTDGGEREAVRFEYFKWEIASETSMVKWIERLQEKAVV